MRIASVLVAITWAGLANAQPIDLTLETFSVIRFNGIKPTNYQVRDNNVLEARVHESGSALVRGFADIRLVEQVSLRWQIEGAVKTETPEHEETKKGDDFPFRLGLCILGEAPLIPFFAPAWIKKVRDVLHHPASKMTYLVVGSKHKPGQTWRSPFSDSLKHIAISSEKDGDWQAASYRFPQPIKVVGLWLMSDGDNTGSVFTVRVKDIFLNKKSLPKEARQ